MNVVIAPEHKLMIEAKHLDFVKESLIARGYRNTSFGWIRREGLSLHSASIVFNGQNWFTVVRK